MNSVKNIGLFECVFKLMSLCLFISACGGGSGGGGDPQPTQTPVLASTSTPTPMPTATEVPSTTPNPSIPPTPIPVSTPTPTAVPSQNPTTTPVPNPTPSGMPVDQTDVDPVEAPEGTFRHNQLGWTTAAEKLSVVTDLNAMAFTVRDPANTQVFLRGDLSTTEEWPPAGTQSIKRADISALNQPGEYILVLDNGMASKPFKVSDLVYADVLKAGLKAYYFNRASTALDAKYAGKWARAEGHPDDQVKIQNQAASAARPAGSIHDGSKGWYDAGDYNKYSVNAGISTYTLLAAYAYNKSVFDTLDTRIPESDSNQVPDILDEIKWNLDWMEKMQDPSDGGVYHKLSTNRFSGQVLPKDATAQRYFVKKSVTATLDFAATMAMASRVYAAFETDFPGKSAAYKAAAESAWEWSMANAGALYNHPQNETETGAYDDQNAKDERTWAAAELFLTTSKNSYWEAYTQNIDPTNYWIPNWQSVQTLADISLLNEAKTVLSAADYEAIKARFLTLADNVTAFYGASAYRVAMRENDFGWGSNGEQLNRAWILLEAYKLDADIKYSNAAQGLLDFVLGRNPLDYSFVTGFGNKTPMKIHHRQSDADSVIEPIPGFVAGGPQNQNNPDNCAYAFTQPARRYLDDWCSYSTNEVTINWNAAFVAVLARLLSK